MAVMSLLIGHRSPDSEELDVCKMIKMALIHDLAEVATGDITPTDGISRQQKLDMESEGLKKILAGVDDDGELYALWEEYNACTTREAKIVNALDKLEMACQAKEYEGLGNKGLEEFYSFGNDVFGDEMVQKIDRGLLEEAEAK
jgi:putative hydrolase of HD superfamily